LKRIILANFKAFEALLRHLMSHIRGLLVASTLSHFDQKHNPICQKLTPTEEQTIVQYIFDLDSRRFVPQLCGVADMADKLLAARGGEPVGKRWAARLVTRSEELKMAFNRAK
jgi:hypothetical protein